jgi:antitoxin component YwqK of YwqJK toxin-antitoxin module
MSMDQYLLSQDELIIRDQQLCIEIALEFSLPRLPLNLEGAGVVQAKDPEGNLESVYLVCEGRRHGECRLFTEEGKLRAEMFYLHGKLHGPSITYGDKGGILSKTWYCDGKRMGKAHFYSVSGELVSLQRFKNGEWEEMQEYFYEGGKVKSLIPFQNGKLHGRVQLFWESGTLKRSAHYVSGLREGKDCLWNEQGILIDEGEYRANQPVGIHRRFYPSGKPKEECVYHTPLRYDRKEWNESSKLVLEGVFSADLTYTEKVFLEPHGAKVRKGVWDANRIRWN